jgi:hypothetical protein
MMLWQIQLEFVRRQMNNLPATLYTWAEGPESPFVAAHWLEVMLTEALQASVGKPIDPEEVILNLKVRIRPYSTRLPFGKPFPKSWAPKPPRTPTFEPDGQESSTSPTVESIAERNPANPEGSLCTVRADAGGALSGPHR